MYLFIAPAAGRPLRKVEHLWEKRVVIMQNRIRFSNSPASLAYENCELEFPFSAQWNDLNGLRQPCLQDFLSALSPQLHFRSLAAFWASEHCRRRNGNGLTSHFVFSHKQKSNRKQAVLGTKVSWVQRQVEFKATLPHTERRSLNSTAAAGNTGTPSPRWGCLTKHRTAWPPSLFNICAINLALMMQGKGTRSLLRKSVTWSTSGSEFSSHEGEVNTWEEVRCCRAVSCVTSTAVPGSAQWSACS